MVVLLISAVAVAVGIWMATTYRWENWAPLVLVPGLAVSLVLIIALPLNRVEARSAIQQFYSVQETGNIARQSGDPMERMAWLQEVSKQNRWLATAQYWSNTTFSLWWPKEIRELEPIR